MAEPKTLLEALEYAVRLSDEEPENLKRLRDVRTVARDMARVLRRGGSYDRT